MAKNKKSEDEIGDAMDSHTSKNENKIHRETFGYLEPADGQEDFAQCSSCILWTGADSERCLILGNKLVVEGTDSCHFYIPGDPEPDRSGDERELLSQEEAGFVKGKVRCENCAEYDSKPSKCTLYAKLNKAMPSDFDLDVKVKSQGCCNAQIPKE